MEPYPLQIADLRRHAAAAVDADRADGDGPSEALAVFADLRHQLAGGARRVGTDRKR